MMRFMTSYGRPFGVLLCAIGLLFLLSGCRALRLDRSDVRSSSGLVTEGDVLFQRYATSTSVEPPLEEAWLYNAGAGFGPGSPLIVGKTVLVATRRGEVHAIDVATGKKSGVENFGDAVEGTPVVQEGMMVLPVAAGRRALIGYELAKGSTRWKIKGAPIEAGLLPLGDGVVGVDVEATVRKYALEDGAVIWEQPLGRAVGVHTTPVIAGGYVAVADDRGGVVALDPDDGSVRWTQAIGVPVYASMTSDQQHLYVPTTRGKVFALDAETGTERWRFALPDTTVRFTPPAVDDGVVVVGASDGFLRALDAEAGTVRWSFEADATLRAAPLITPNVVYAGTMDRMLYAVDRATGSLVWKEELRGRVKSALAAREGYLVVLTEPRYVYLFKSTSASNHVVSP